jgi:hypothetical protein
MLEFIPKQIASPTHELYNAPPTPNINKNHYSQFDDGNKNLICNLTHRLIEKQMFNEASKIAIKNPRIEIMMQKKATAMQWP